MRIIPTPPTVDIRAGSHEAAAPSQALVPVVLAAAPVRQMQITRPDARFVTQLIATAAHAPQTCALRRAEIADGIVLYGAVAEMTEPPRPSQGRLLSRVA